MMMRELILTACLAFVAFATFSQTTIDAEYRPRSMVDGGYKTIKLVTDPTLIYISQRSRLNIGYKSEKLETYFSIQDVRFWGDDDNYSSTAAQGSTKGVSVHQAWFMFKPSEKISIKTGRQQFSYDDQRILSARNWNDYQVTYDALLFQYNTLKSKIDVAVSWNASGSSDALFPKGKLKTVDFVRYEHPFGKLNFSAIALLTGNTLADTVSDIALLGTYGVGLLYDQKDFNFRFNGYYQTGMNENCGEISAWCLSVFGQKKLMESKAAIGIGADCFSGHDGTNTDAAYKATKHNFNLLYGNRHGWLGYMDFFSSIPTQGIQDLMLKAEYNPLKVVKLNADYHYFAYSAKSYDITNPTKLAAKRLGSELDLTLQWKIMKEATLQAGYSFMLPTETLEKYKKVYGKNIRFPQFAFVMITVKPKLL
jgi:hypothetical protein